jgi:hypothetical protein
MAAQCCLKALALLESINSHFSRLSVLDSLDLDKITDKGYEELVGALIKDDGLKKYLKSSPVTVENPNSELTINSLML